MDCPSCGKEIEEGMIHNRYPLIWRKGTNRHDIKWVSKEDITLSRSIVNGAAIKVFYCRDCKKMIIDCADPHSDLNNYDPYHY